MPVRSLSSAGLWCRVWAIFCFASRALAHVSLKSLSPTLPTRKVQSVLTTSELPPPSPQREKQRQERLFLPIYFPFCAIQDFNFAFISKTPIHRRLLRLARLPCGVVYADSPHLRERQEGF